MMTSARTAVPPARPSAALSKTAEYPSARLAPGAMVTCGASDSGAFVVALVNVKAPDAEFSVKLERPSELPAGTTCAVVAVSPLVASATSEERVAQFDPDFVWRFTTTLPMGAA